MLISALVKPNFDPTPGHRPKMNVSPLTSRDLKVGWQG